MIRRSWIVLDGVISGRALYDGRIDMAEAVALMNA